MAIVQLRDVSIAFGADPILDNVNLKIDAGERIGVIGRNGAGKSTLLKLMNNELAADDGEVIRQQSIISARLIQEVPAEANSDIQSIVAQGHDEHGELLSSYYAASAIGGDEALDSSDIIDKMNQSGAWQTDQNVKKVCSVLGLEKQESFAKLSGGRKRKVMLARALVSDPDILLLDEPTNHLDIETILWLESFLLGLNKTLLIISHDRAFIDKLCTRIIELDRGHLSSWPGNYAKYLSGKAKAIKDEEIADAKFDKKLAQEEAWIRQGIKARRTRNEGRVRALKELRKQRAQRREKQANADFSINQADKSGKVVIRAKHLKQCFAETNIINDFSCKIMRGDKVGIIGPNGCGKSTLVRFLTQQTEPEHGSVKLGTNLSIAYLDQLRDSIVDSASVRDNVSGGSDQITINGQTKHIIGYLQDFLFDAGQANAPAKKLSGGERNRLLLAKLFTQPFNLLILDEPTNDLDYETLELLEQLLIDYSGTLLLVSHDRAFLNNVVTSTIAFEGEGQVHEYIGGYDDWLEQRRETDTQQKPESKPQASQEHNQTSTDSASKQQAKPKKLSYNLQRELDALPEKIDTLETQLAELQEQMSAPDFYQQDEAVIGEAGNNLKELQAQLDACFERWQELEC